MELGGSNGQELRVCVECGRISVCGHVHVYVFAFPAGPVVGEFPAQNDVNLAPAPALPQVTEVWSGTCS